MSSIAWPTIVIPAHTSRVVLQVFGYNIFLHRPTNLLSSASEAEIQAWLTSLPNPTTYADMATDTTIDHVEVAPPPPVQTSTGIPWLDTLIQQLRDITMPITTTMITIGQFLTSTMAQLKAAGTNTTAFITWLDTPQTVERIGAVLLGGSIVVLGVIATITSFTGTPSVGDIVKAVT